MKSTLGMRRIPALNAKVPMNHVNPSQSCPHGLPKQQGIFRAKKLLLVNFHTVQEGRWKTTNQMLDCFKKLCFNLKTLKEILIFRYSTESALKSPNSCVLECPPNTSAGPLDLRRNKQQNVTRRGIYDQWDVQLFSCPNNSWFCDSGISKTAWIQAVVVDGWVNDQHVKNFRPERKTKSSAWTIKHVGCLPPQQSLDRHSCHDTLVSTFSASCAWSIIKLRNLSTSMEISSQNLEANGFMQSRSGSNSKRKIQRMCQICHSIPCTFGATEYRRHRDFIWPSVWRDCIQHVTTWHSIQIEVIVCSKSKV